MGDGLQERIVISLLSCLMLLFLEQGASSLISLLETRHNLGL